MWFIVKISFIKKKNCPDTLNYYATNVTVLYVFSFFFYLRSFKAKPRSLVIRKITRAVDKDKQLVRTPILKAMMMLKKAWGERTEQTIRNCFRKSRTSLKAQEGAMDDHNDLLKGMVDDGDDKKAVDELECDLNQICKARSDLAPENLDADGLDDFDREVATNESRPLSVDEFVIETFHNLLKPLNMAAVTRMVFPMNPYHQHHKMKLTRQLKS